MRQPVRQSDVTSKGAIAQAARRVIIHPAPVSEDNPSDAMVGSR